MGFTERISVVVPVYNVASYLEKCIESIIAQTYEKLEIILVDDGSTDDSGRICDDYAKEDTRIKVIHKKNGGLSDARNKGIDAASGEYLMFIDSDDYIHPQMAEKLYKTLVNAGAEISVCNFLYVDEKGETLDGCNDNLPVMDEILNQNEAFYKAIQGPKKWYYVIACNKLYKKQVFSDLRFPCGKIHEDEFVIHKVLDVCSAVACTSDVLYYYVQRTGSIMHAGYSIKKLDMVDVYLERTEYFLRKKMPAYAGTSVSNAISEFCFGYNSLDLNNSINKNRLKALLPIFKKIYCKVMHSSISLKHKVRFSAFLISPKLDGLLMRLYEKKFR